MGLEADERFVLTRMKELGQDAMVYASKYNTEKARGLMITGFGIASFIASRDYALIRAFLRVAGTAHGARSHLLEKQCVSINNSLEKNYTHYRFKKNTKIKKV